MTCRVVFTARRLCLYFFFFFQAEDGIRDLTVTGVQTCALPIFVAQSGLYGSNPSCPYVVGGHTYTVIRAYKDKKGRELVDIRNPQAEDGGKEIYLANEDRKSTRLNSSHSQISYAVFCLKTKNTK